MGTVRGEGDKDTVTDNDLTLVAGTRCNAQIPRHRNTRGNLHNNLIHPRHPHGLNDENQCMWPSLRQIIVKETTILLKLKIKLLDFSLSRGSPHSKPCWLCVRCASSVTLSATPGHGCSEPRTRYVVLSPARCARQKRPADSRGEGVVLLLAPDALAAQPLGLLVVEVQLVEAVGEGQQHQAVYEQELEDVQQHPAQRDLQGPQVRVRGEQGDEAQRAEDVGDGEERLGHQRGVPHVPGLAGVEGAVLGAREAHRDGETSPPPRAGQVPAGRLFRRVQRRGPESGSRRPSRARQQDEFV